MYIYLFIYIYIYLYINIHTHTHTHTYILKTEDERNVLLPIPFLLPGVTPHTPQNVLTVSILKKEFTSGNYIQYFVITFKRKESGKE